MAPSTPTAYSAGMTPRLLLVLVTSIAIAACGSSATPADPEEPACGSGGPLMGPGGDFNGPYMERTLTMKDGTERTYLLRLPAGYRDGVRADVVFNFHGSGSDATEQLVYGDLTAQADRDGVILVSPDANKVFPDSSHELSGYWSSAWEANLRVRDHDVDFVLELVEQLQSEYCTGDFHATGMSAGGDMVSALECLAESPFQGHAAVTYGYFNEPECGDAPPRPLLYFHGTDDFVVPFAGSGPPWNDPPVPDLMQNWAEHNGCSPEPIEERVSDEVLRYYWNGCDAKTEWYLVEGGGHTWPGAIEIPGLGHTTTDISASDLIWEHFFGD